MTKEEKIAIQKKEMTGCMNYFKNNQLDFNDTKDAKFYNKNISSGNRRIRL